MKPFKTALFFLLICSAHHAIAQKQSLADSLIGYLNTNELPDSVRIKIYGDISWELMGTDINRSLEYAKKELGLSVSNRRKADEAQSESDLGNVFNRMGMYDSALIHYFSGLKIRQSLGQADKVAGIYTNIATVYMRQNKFREALEINFKTLKIFEEQKDTVKQANVLGNIGNIYYELEQYRIAEQFQRKGLALARNTRVPALIGNLLVNLGGLKFAENELDSALYYFSAAGTLLEENYLPYNLAAVYNNIGKIYLEKKNYTMAVDFYNKGLIKRKLLNDQFGIGLSYMNLGELYMEMGENDKAIGYLNKAIEIFASLGSYINLKQTYGHLAEAYEAKGDYKGAIRFFRLYSQYKDSVYTKDNAEKMAEMQTRFETEKKDLEIDKKNTELALNKTEIRRKNTITYVLVFFILFSILITYLFYTRYKLKQKNILDTALLKQKELRSKAIIETEEKERMRIARDLHDGIGQTLSAAKLNLSGLESKLNLQDDSRIMLKNALELVDESVKEVRAVSHNMMPNALLKSGLVAAVREFIHKLSAAGSLKIDLEITGLDDRLEPSTETVLFRVLQEIVGNIIKHANATYMSIQIIRHENELSMLIEDNGSGFSVEKMNEFSGIGLKNIVSRVEFLNGTVHFDSQPGKGTTVAIEVPC